MIENELDTYLEPIGSFVMDNRRKAGLVADDEPFMAELIIRIKELYPGIIVGQVVPMPEGYTGPGNFMCDLDPPTFSQN